MPEQTGTTRPDPDGITRARFRNVTDGEAGGEEIHVHFNPESLEYQLQNNVDRRGNSNTNKQYVSESTGKLTLQLLFDTTDTGKDVRGDTERLQALMKPKVQGRRRVAQVVQFEWGVFRFRGTFESYRETLDYFSATGVPLRGSVDLTMAQQDGVFEPSEHGEDVDVAGTLELTPTEGQSADEAGVPREVAEQNGEEDLRNLSGKAISIPQEPNLRPPPAFASGSFGVSLSAGINAQLGIGVEFDAALGLGVSAGASFGAGGGFGVSAGLGGQFAARAAFGQSGSAAEGAVFGGSSLNTNPAARTATSLARVDALSNGVLTPPGSPNVVATSALFGAVPVARESIGFGGDASTGASSSAKSLSGPLWGAQASAGTPATFGAFAGLNANARELRSRSRLRRPAPPKPAEAVIHTNTGTAFEVGGRALNAGPSGLAADVGARATLASRIRFDGE